MVSANHALESQAVSVGQANQLNGKLNADIRGWWNDLEHPSRSDKRAIILQCYDVILIFT